MPINAVAPEGPISFHRRSRVKPSMKTNQDLYLWGAAHCDYCSFVWVNNSG
jgi:hypothetical protein